jgi:hypothetical protein
MDMDKEKHEIEEAFELVKDTNFQLFVDRLAKFQTEDSIKHWFGGSVKEVPDISKIYAERDANNTGTLSYIEDYVNFPDAKLRLQNHVGQLARLLLHNRENLNKIRQGETIWLNMELIGQLWSKSELLIKYRSVLLNVDKVKKKPLPTLEDIFSDKKKLKKPVEVLIAKGFVERRESGSLLWTGIKHDQARGRKLQLVALSDICKPFYIKTDYEQKELHHAWTTYFNFELAQNMFSKEKRQPEDSQYHRLFNNLLTSI